MLAVEIGFMTPAYAVAGLAFAAAAAATLVSARRARAARGAFGLSPGPRRWLAADLGLLVACASLLALACAQPAVSRTETRYVSVGVRVGFVFDVSRSMLAAARPGAPTRLDRARQAALRIRESVPAIPVGALSLTDRVFPLVFPDTDLRLFRDAVAQTVGIEEPPPRLVGSRSATDFRSLIDLALGPYFRPPVRRQAIVVFSDAETETPAASLAESFAQRHIRVYVVRFWHRNERVWTHRRPERYRPDASALPSVKRFVTATHGKLFSEHDEAAVASELRKLTRGGKRIPIGATHDRRPLAPYLIGLAVLPLAAWTRRRSR